MKRYLPAALVGVVLLGLIFLSGCRQVSSAPTPTRPAAISHKQSKFSTAYVNERRGKVLVEVPEAYELANILVAISPEGRKHPYRVLKNGDYYQRVLDHFMKYKDHPAVQAVNFTDKQILDYYAFRENAFGYIFDGDRLVYGGVYATNFGEDLFGAYLDVVTDFAQVSGFRQFYAGNAAYYTEQVERYRQIVPVSELWGWLETEFPNRHDAYRVVFSPLIRASHSTQTYSDNGYSETVMFVAGPDLYAAEKVEPKVEAGLLARVVLTEIDHNYINPVSAAYAGKIRKAFADVGLWNAQQEADLYYNPISTFNEYMTWAVFTVYAHATYPPEVAEELIARTVETMQTGRGFNRFGEFQAVLLELFEKRLPGQRISDLYPKILDWAEGVEK